ncbi:MAG: hypothetical protein IPH31_23060 [Lewinellaceae bacterium]|nr:hypothetical protein [Lewinellaceae bacterium]
MNRNQAQSSNWGGMPLNKYLAHCGLSSRRKAVDYVEAGKVTVNGEVKEPAAFSRGILSFATAN